MNRNELAMTASQDVFKSRARPVFRLQPKLIVEPLVLSVALETMPSSRVELRCSKPLKGTTWVAEKCTAAF